MHACLSEVAVKYRVAILVPSNPRLHPKLKAILDENLYAVLEANPRLDLKIYVDSGPLSELPEDQRPLSKTARLRNRMLDSIDLVSPFSVCLSLALCLHDVSVMSGCLGAL